MSGAVGMLLNRRRYHNIHVNESRHQPMVDVKTRLNRFTDVGVKKFKEKYLLTHLISSIYKASGVDIKPVFLDLF